MPLPAAFSYAIEVVDTSGLSEEDWLGYRRQGIGGSDVAAIMGVSPFATLRDLYNDKCGNPDVIQTEDNWVASSCGKAPDRRRPFTCRAEPGSADGRIWTAAQGSGYCTHGNPVRETAWRCPDGRPHGKQQRNERLPVAYILAPLSAGKGDALRRPLSFCFYIRKLRTQRRKTIHSS